MSCLFEWQRQGQGNRGERPGVTLALAPPMSLALFLWVRTPVLSVKQVPELRAMRRYFVEFTVREAGSAGLLLEECRPVKVLPSRVSGRAGHALWLTLGPVARLNPVSKTRNLLEHQGLSLPVPPGL